MVDSYHLISIFYKVKDRAVKISNNAHAYFIKDSDEIDTGMILKEIKLIREGLDLAKKIIEEDV